MDMEMKAWQRHIIGHVVEGEIIAFDNGRVQEFLRIKSVGRVIQAVNERDGSEWEIDVTDALQVKTVTVAPWWQDVELPDLIAYVALDAEPTPSLYGPAYEEVLLPAGQYSLYASQVQAEFGYEPSEGAVIVLADGKLITADLVKDIFIVR